MSQRIEDLTALERKVQSRIKSIESGSGFLGGVKAGLPFDPVLAPPSRPIFPRPNTNVASYKDWEKRDPDPASPNLKSLYNKFKGERCFIIGNGPSLNNHDLSKLEGEHVFAVNSFYYKTRETGFRPTFFVVEDDKVMEENYEHFVDYDCPYKFFPTEYRKYIPESESTYFFKMNHGYYQDGNPYFGVPRFSTNAFDEVFCGQTVTYINLQLAHYLGFTQVYLIGMDFHYVIPEEHRRDGHLILSTTDDPNHFHKDYFGAGKTWKDPKLDRVAANYRLAKLSFESSGRRVYNATIGGKLEIFDRVDYPSLFPFSNERDGDGNLLLPQVVTYGEGSYQPKSSILPVDVRSTSRTEINSEALRSVPENEAPATAQVTTAAPHPRETEKPSSDSISQLELIESTSDQSESSVKTETQPAPEKTEHGLRSKYPKTFGAFQIIRRVLASLWRRRFLVLPIIVIASIPIMTQIIAPDTLFGSVLDAMMVTAIIGMGLALGYIALRAYISFRSLSYQTTRLADWISVVDRRRSDFGAEIAGLREDLQAHQVASDSAASILRDKVRTLAASDRKTLKSVDEVSARIREFQVAQQKLERAARANSNICADLKKAQDHLKAYADNLYAQGQRDSQALSEQTTSMIAGLERLQEENELSYQSLKESTAALEITLDSIGPLAEQSQKDIEVLSARTSKIAEDSELSYQSLKESTAALENTLASIGSLAEQSQKDIEVLSTRTSKIVSESDHAASLFQETQQKVSSLEEGASNLTEQVAGLGTYSVGLDIAVVARSMRTLWLGGSGFERRTRELEREHGHVLLMDMLALIEREKPGSLAGKTLIEVGMTREPHRSQRSTQKLGLFAALMDLYYIGVDIDPKNVTNAKKILAYLNPGAQSYVSKGEDFLRLHSGTIDFVYLDAYDFYHDNHSPERQEVYKRQLGSEISDEQCWKMHADCAETLIKRLSPGGVVALDDTWKSADGEWQGKGKLAAPMFLSADFKIMASSENTICFQRDSN